MSDNLDSIRRKIAALFAKAENSATSEEEAAIFMDKAFELLAKYNLTRDDLGSDEDDPIGGMSINDYYKEEWRGVIWDSVARLYGCKCYFRKVKTKKRRSDGTKDAAQYLMFGRKSNVFVASSMAMYLVRTVVRMANSERRLLKTLATDGRFQKNFMKAAAQRLSERIDAILDNKMRAHVSNGTNLPAIYKDDSDGIDKFMDETLGNFRIKDHGDLVVQEDAAGSKEGYEAGDRIGLDTQLETKSQTYDQLA